MKDSCGLESLKEVIESTNRLITALRPYIQVHVNLREASPSPQNPPPKKFSIQSKLAKKKLTKMSESEDSSSTNEEDNCLTLGQS